MPCAPSTTAELWQDDPNVAPILLSFCRNRPSIISTLASFTALQVFFLFFDGEFWGNLARQTNLYARDQRHDNTHESRRRRSSHHRPWRNVDVEDLQKFVGLLFAMGLNVKPQIDHYWSEDSIYKQNLYKRIMPVDRCKDILKFLHIVDNWAHAAHSSNRLDPLWKIRPFIDGLLANFKGLFSGKQLSLDEGTCPFRGQVRCRAYTTQRNRRNGG